MRGPIVLVNGAWHGAWCWSLVVEELAAVGTAAVAVEPAGFGGLRGFSPDQRWSRPWSEDYLTAPSGTTAVTLDSAADALVERLRRIGRGRPCTLVGHSLGGVVVTAAAERAPELVANVVYLSAVAPVLGAVAIVYQTSAEMAGSLLPDCLVGDPATSGTLRIDPLDAAGRDRVLASFYQDVDADRARAAASMLASDAPSGIPATAFPVTAERFGRLPHTYIVCLRDRILVPAMARRFVTELDSVSARPTTVYELDSGHSPFLSDPERLATVLAEIDAAGIEEAVTASSP